MGQYRLSIYFKTQIGILFKYDSKTIYIELPFVKIIIALDKYAEGYYIFGLKDE